MRVEVWFSIQSRMALSIKDPETDALVRKLAKARGTSFTGAVRLAVENELAREAAPKRKIDWEAVRRIQKSFADKGGNGMTAEEADAWMYDENGLPH